MTSIRAEKNCNCGAGRVFAVMLILGAFALTVFAGLFVAGLFFLMLLLPHQGPAAPVADATAAMPAISGMLPQILGGLSGFMMVAMAVLLLLILILLAVLLWCCCRGGLRGVPADLIAALLPLLPHVRDIGPALRASVTALKASSVALAKIQEAGDRLGEIANVTGGNVDVWKKGDEILSMLGFYSIKNETESKSVSGFGDVTTAIGKVKSAGDLLKTPAVGVSDIKKAKDAVDAAATLLDPIATALGAPPA